MDRIGNEYGDGEFDSELLDVLPIPLPDLLASDNPVLIAAVRRVVEELVADQEPISGWNSVAG
jgi:FXSXX-COOH protein